MKIREKRGDDEFQVSGWFAHLAVREWRKSLVEEKVEPRVIGFTPNENP